MNMIGQPIDRVDGRLKVTGDAKYAAEFRVPGMVHAALVNSTIGAGTIAGFDLHAAQQSPGVLLIMTPDNAPKLTKTSAGPVHGPFLQDRNVLFNGQHIALVVAETLDQAHAAAALVKVRYKTGEAITRMDLALAYTPKQFRMGQRPPDTARGDADGAFDRAPTRLEVEYATPIEHHNPMEPHATVARWEGGKLTVWTATQGISSAQATLAGQFGIDKTAVHVICPYVGGGFGCKGNLWPYATIAAMAAKQVGRPVRLELTRAQMFTANGYRPATIQQMKFAADAEGKLASLRHDGFSQMSSETLGEFSEPVALSTEMLYACPNVSVSHRVVPTSMPLPTFMRAPGKASGTYALEAAIDELAQQVGMDPLEFRIRNYADSDPHENKPFASKKLLDCYHAGAEAFGWANRPAKPRAMRDDDALIGWGVATATYPTEEMPAHAQVRLNRDGSLLVRSGTQDLGTGTYTVMTQIAAERLGLPLEKVRFQLGDSTFPQAGVSGGSTTAASVGNAVAAACDALRERLFDAALAGSRVNDRSALRLENGAVVGPDLHQPVGDLVGTTGFIEASGEGGKQEAKKRFSTHSFGAHFVEVRVDADLGEIRVSRYVGAFDGGRILNAKTARSQLIGGVVFGIGMALLEETHVDADSGRIVNANIAEYLVPVNLDIPDLQTIIVPNDEHNSNPLGIKGIGELPTVGVAAAVANAVYHATGVRVRKLPIRIEDVLR